MTQSDGLFYNPVLVFTLTDAQEFMLYDAFSAFGFILNQATRTETQKCNCDLPVHGNQNVKDKN